MRLWKCLLPVLASSLCFAVQPDRIISPIDSAQMVRLRGNVHGQTRTGMDLGRTDSSKPLQGVSLEFRPSASQQKALDTLLAQQQDRTSPNYHKWLTPAQFADRFGLTHSDVQRITDWLQSQGFSNISVSNSRNQISFDGTVAQVEAVFGTEFHSYMVDGVAHFANASEPSVPAALAGAVVSIGHLHDFSPKPRAIVRPHLTSYVSGNHFLSPADFATIYDLQALYSAGINGTGQKIAIVGQSSVNSTDLSNFRTAAGLAANAPTLSVLSGQTSTRCAGDEGESDLDLEWAGGVAKNASITFVYAGLVGADTCSNRSFNVWDALQFAVTSNVAPVISTSYGFCESGLGQSFVSTLQTWAQQANSQGQTIVSATGDSGAADCDGAVSSATQGLAVDSPASVPEVTGAGGNEFSADAPNCPPTAPCPPGANPPYWAAAGTSSDLVSSALEYIPEKAWNDTAANGSLSASGGGASIFFSKPTWQTGTGVPNDGKRDVPDISLSSSPDHDGYLFCSEDGSGGAIVSTCTSGFRNGAGGSFAIVGGTSAAAPTFSAILALVNQYLGNVPPGGLGNVNPQLYQFAAGGSSPFHDIPAGSNNIVPCTSGTPNCPASAPFQYGFSTATGYDQVTGLGSVDADLLAHSFAAGQTSTTTSLAPSSNSIVIGQSVTLMATVMPSAVAGGFVNFYNGTTLLGSGTINSSGSASLATTALPGGSNSITATYDGSSLYHTSTSSAVSVTVILPHFTLTPSVATLTLTPGQTINNTVNLTVASSDGFTVTSGGNTTTVLPVTYSCTATPAVSEGPTCAFSPSATTSSTTPTVAIGTVAATAQLRPAPTRRNAIFYAMLLPGLFGIIFLSGPRSRGLRILGLIVVLGCSVLWLGSCGGSTSHSQSNPGTPAGNYTVTVNATTSSAISASTQFTVTVQ